jgi:hypothetical protein
MLKLANESFALTCELQESRHLLRWPRVLRNGTCAPPKIFLGEVCGRTSQVEALRRYSARTALSRSGFSK